MHREKRSFDISVEYVVVELFRNLAQGTNPPVPALAKAISIHPFALIVWFGNVSLNTCNVSADCHLPCNFPILVTLPLIVITLDFSLGVHSAIHGKIRPGNVRGLWTGDKRYHCGDLLNAPVAVECCGCLLRPRPIARGGIQIRVDRTRLDVVDSNAPAPDLSG